MNSETRGDRKTRKNPWVLWVVGGVVLVVVAVVTFFVIRQLSVPLKVTKAETTNALSSRVADAEVKAVFVEAEPVMLHFEYAGAATGVAVGFEVLDGDGEVVKSGSTTILRLSDSDADTGQRYVSIVNTGNTALGVGRYTIRLFVDDRTVKTLDFEVVSK